MTALARKYRLTILAVAISAAPLAADGAPDKPVLRTVADKSGRPIAIEAVGLPTAELAKLTKRDDAQEALGRILSVHVVDDPPDPDRPAMAGRYSVDHGTIRFTPRFSLRPGVTYRALLAPARLRADGGSSPSESRRDSQEISLEIKLPDAPLGPATEVTCIYPSAGTLPENQLRFYVHFSAAMGRGAAYTHLRMLDSKGRAIPIPFLELGEELWDAGARRFTLFIDPGRIKRGLKPREDLGPVLEAGGQYTLAVDRDWRDADGRPLREEFKKTFRVGPPIEAAIDPAQWKIITPASGSIAALKVTFPRPLDHALVQRTISVVNADGDELPGSVRVANEERLWEFVPELHWRTGKYQLLIDTALEDLAGNRLGEQFEVDRVGDIEKNVRPEFVRLPFAVK